MRKLLLITIFILFSSTVPVTATPILDQVSFENPHTPAVASTLNYRDIAQTFTVGISGTLTRVDIPILKSPSLTTDPIFDIRRTVGGIPVEDDNDILASITVPNESMSSDLPRVFFPIEDLNVLVNSGDVLAMVLRIPDEPTTNGEVSWSVVFEDQYSRGNRFIRDEAWTDTPWSNGWSNDTIADHDLVFRTFVDPIPEPSSTISGFVTDSTYILIQGAKVKLKQKGVLIDETTTDVNGYYEFKGLADGKYVVIGKKGGFTNDKKIGKVSHSKPWAKEEYINLVLE